MSTNTAPYGSWESPVTPESFTERTVTISQLRMDGADIYWVEDNPQREGRSVLLRRDAMGQTMEALPLLEGARLVTVETSVHGRGGRAYAVRDGFLVVSDGFDNRVYGFRVSDRGRTLVPLTPLSDRRYGDFEIDHSRGLVYAVEEDRSPVKEGGDPRNCLVAIPLDGSAARSPEKILTVFDGTDFVSSPTLSHDMERLAWISWDRPDMPWTRSVLHVGALGSDGLLLSDVKLVDHRDVCVYEPRWALDGDLIHVDDSTGWANFYRTEGFERRAGEPHDAWETRLRTRALHPAGQAFSQPHWLLGNHTYDNLDSNHLVCTWVEDGEQHLGAMRLDNGLLEEWQLGWWPVGNVASDSGRVIFLGDSPQNPPSIVEVVDREAIVIRPSSEMTIPAGCTAIPHHIDWRNRDDSTGHGLLYLPENGSYSAPAGTKPPLLVTVNPLPTMAAKPGMDYETQFWTSRGFAVLKVNLRGSTGWGKEYRSGLDGNWGVMEVQDCVDAALAMRADGIVDPNRIAVRGESMGAITALNAVESSEAFTAAVVGPGLGRARDLVKNSHKFAADYPKRLLGSFDQEDAVWDERDPLEHLDRVSAPVLLLQGGADALTPPNVVQEAYTRLAELGKKAALVLLPEEGHSFAGRRSVRKAWNTELAFYGQVWGFPTSSDIEVQIAND